MPRLISKRWIQGLMLRTASCIVCLIYDMSDTLHHHFAISGATNGRQVSTLQDHSLTKDGTAKTLVLEAHSGHIIDLT